MSKFFKKDLIITGGCSYTERYVDRQNKNYKTGAIWKWDHKKSESVPVRWKYTEPFDVWPEIISKNLNLKLWNTACSGDGNDAIFTKVYDAISKDPKRVSVVMVLWSEWTRRDVERYVLDKKNVEIMNTRFNNGKDERNLLKKDIFASYFKSGVFDYRVSVNNFLRNSLILSQICQQYNIQLIQSQAINPINIIELTNHVYSLTQDKNNIYDMKKYENLWKTFSKSIKKKYLTSAIKYFLDHDYFSKIENMNNFIGWPIFSEIGGYYLGKKTEELNSIYRLSEDDQHPNKLCHQYFANEFLNQYKKF